MDNTRAQYLLMINNTDIQKLSSFIIPDYVQVQINKHTSQFLVAPKFVSNVSNY